MPQFPFLSQITFIRMRITFEAVEPLVLTEYPGSALRSCMMEAMLGSACIKQQKTECIATCDERYTCPWSVLFNSYSLPEHPHHKNHVHTPEPYIIEPFAGNQTVFKKGETFGFDFTLIGKGISYLHLVISSFQNMGDIGIGRCRGKFKPVRLESLNANLDYEPLSYFGQPEVLSLSKLMVPKVEKKIIIDQQTEFRTKVGKKLLTTPPPFQLFVKQLTIRLSLLAHFHCEAAWFDFKNFPFPTEVEMKDEDTQIEHLERKSRTMKPIMKMDGPVGKFIYEGEGLNDWMPLITLGSWLHVGSTTSMGLGKYAIIEE